MSNASAATGSYRPDESAVEIFSEHTWLQGAFLAAIAYGIEAVLFFMSARLLWVARSKDEGTERRNLILIGYISTIYVLGTLYMAGLFQFTQLSFIDNRNIPGGPNQYENIMFSLPIDMLANVIMVLLTWMCDIINVWRCGVIYRGSRIPWYLVVALPACMYLASIALGMLFLKQVGTVSASPWDTSGINWTVPYYSMSLALNVLVTLLIVARLLLCRAQVNRAMGATHGSQYTSLAAMIVESAAIYSTFALLFLVPFVINTPTSIAVSQLFLQGLSPIQVVSTLLIIFRVASGRAWSAKTTQTLTGGQRGTGDATHTIGGHTINSKANSSLRIRTVTQTETYPGYGYDHDHSSHDEVHTKEAVSLQTFSDKTRTVNFDALPSEREHAV
ncbi:hypothetical protein MIND_00979200 [Mycena indigotica]|uniref:Uncharacterized protein n=1 Tax=Mycena indigotica TaxID=2126181 RepID=A0A8H6SDC4_9AGAR|nr:uncharacterized protein MIND_00979200 [Mycena indigotica]KAF7297455.1 hypothetical protein MIND_00979200 [Mycena indigotica]